MSYDDGCAACFKKFEDDKDCHSIRSTNYCRVCFYAIRDVKFYLNDNDPFDYMGGCDDVNAPRELRELIKILRTASPKDKYDYLKRLRWLARQVILDNHGTWGLMMCYSSLDIPRYD